jgi:protein-tyrosine-phosphatase
VATLEERLPGRTRVLFVCSGNVVRSAFAHLYAVHLGCPLAVGSAATTYRNPGLFTETIAALRTRGVPQDAIAAFRPRHVEDLVPDRSTLVLGMTTEHLRALASRGWPPDGALLLDAVLAPARPRSIRDPVQEGADFGATFEHVARAVQALVATLRASG